MPRLLIAFLWGIAAFVVTYVILLIIAAVLRGAQLVDAAAVISNFAWVLSLLVGLLYGFSRYGSPVIR